MKLEQLTEAKLSGGDPFSQYFHPPQEFLPGGNHTGVFWLELKDSKKFRVLFNEQQLGHHQLRLWVESTEPGHHGLDQDWPVTAKIGDGQLYINNGFGDGRNFEERESKIRTFKNKQGEQERGIFLDRETFKLLEIYELVKRV